MIYSANLYLAPYIIYNNMYTRIYIYIYTQCCVLDWDYQGHTITIYTEVGLVSSYHTD